MINGAIPDGEVDLLGFDGIFPGYAGINSNHFSLVEGPPLPVVRVVRQLPPCSYTSPDLPGRVLLGQPHGINGGDGSHRK